MYYTTLWKLQNCESYKGEWDFNLLLKSLNKKKLDDEPISLLTILELLGIENAVWVLRAVDNIEKLSQLYAIRCVRQHCQQLLTDKQFLDALDVTELCTTEENNNNYDELKIIWATIDELLYVVPDAIPDAARDAARDAAWNTAWSAARAAAREAEPRDAIKKSARNYNKCHKTSRNTDRTRSGMGSCTENSMENYGRRF